MSLIKYTFLYRSSTNDILISTNDGGYSAIIPTSNKLIINNNILNVAISPTSFINMHYKEVESINGQTISALNINSIDSLSTYLNNNCFNVVPVGTGSTIRNGVGIPSNTLGSDNDYYLDNIYPNNLYKRIGGVYVIQTALSTSLYQIINKTVSYTLNLSDANKIIDFDSSTAVSVTIPLDVTVSYPIGTTITIVQFNVGQVTISATTGVTILSSSNKYKLASQYSLCTIIKRTANQWYLSGDLTV